MIGIEYVRDLLLIGPNTPLMSLCTTIETQPSVPTSRRAAWPYINYCPGHNPYETSSVAQDMSLTLFTPFFTCYLLFPPIYSIVPAWSILNAPQRTKPLVSLPLGSSSKGAMLCINLNPSKYTRTCNK